MILQPGKCDRFLVFQEDFRNRGSVQSRGGIVVASSFSGQGINPTTAASRVTFNGTQDRLVNSSQMTVELRFRTGSVVPTNKYMLCKGPITFDNNQWYMIFAAGSLLLYVSSSAADTGNYFGNNVGVVANTEYVFLHVYNGDLAAGSRGVVYSSGGLVASSITGVLPPTMRACPSPMTMFQANGGTIHAPSSDFKLRSVRVWQIAANSEEAADLTANRTWSEVFS